MTNLSFDAFASECLHKLATRQRHVSFLLGAGTSLAVGLPDIAGLAAAVKKRLSAEHSEDPLVATYDRLMEGRNLEQFLTRLRAIADLLDAGDGEIDGIDHAAAVLLDTRVCECIAAEVARPPETRTYHRQLAGWLGRASYDLPVELFTLNYDLLLEEGMESVGVPYFDGFVGIFEGQFRADLVDALYETPVAIPRGWVRLWKLHGSVSWAISDDGSIRRYGRQPGLGGDDKRPQAIYPSARKYEESRRLPFVTLFDRFRRSLELPESVTFTVGYSYGDDHVNELLFNAAERFPRSEVIALVYGDAPDHLRERAEAVPNLTVAGSDGVIRGSVSHNWDPGDGTDPPAGVQHLGDFQNFVRALNRSENVRDADSAAPATT
jgi:SIR2-like domain